MWTQKSRSLSTQGNWCANTTLFDWCTHRFLCVGTGFSCVIYRVSQKMYFCLIKRKMNNKRGIFKIQIVLNYQ